MAAPLPEEWRLLEGSEVYAADGDLIGTILGFIPEDPEDGAPDYFIVEKGLFSPEDFYLPVAAVASYGEGSLRIGVTRAEAERQGWGEVPVGADVDREADPQVPETS